MNKAQTSYRIIGYGDYEHGFFNQFNWGTTLMSAYNQFQNLIADPEMDGAVIIEVQHETWRVIEQFGREDVSVEYGPLGNFKVTKAPKLVLL
jgi:hypothetical protein